jgi:hypothetical protein
MPSTSHDYRRWHARDCCYGLLASLPWMTTTGASTWKSRLTSGRESNAARSGRGTQRRRSRRCARSSTRRPRQSVARCACSKTKGSCAATPAADTTSPRRDPLNDHRAGALSAHNGSQSSLTITNVCKRFLRSGCISECMRPAPFLEGPRYSKSGGAPLTRGRPGTALNDDRQVHDMTAEDAKAPTRLPPDCDTPPVQRQGPNFDSHPDRTAPLRPRGHRRRHPHSGLTGPCRRGLVRKAMASSRAERSTSLAEIIWSPAWRRPAPSPAQQASRRGRKPPGPFRRPRPVPNSQQLRKHGRIVGLVVGAPGSPGATWTSGISRR